MNEDAAAVHRSSFIVHRSALSEGIQLFNAAHFWHAHEAWEKAWLTLEGDDKLFFQGLIQLAAAYHHVTRGTYSGGVRLFDAALEKLEPAAEGHFGVDRSAAVSAARKHRERIARGESIAASEYPKLLQS